MCDGDAGLACLMVVTHLIAGALTVGLVFAPGSHRRTAEFWLLLIYWAGIAGWVVIPGIFVGVFSVAIAPALPWACTRVSGVAAILIPLLSLGRLVWSRLTPTARESS